MERTGESLLVQILTSALRAYPLSVLSNPKHIPYRFLTFHVFQVEQQPHHIFSQPICVLRDAGLCLHAVQFPVRASKMGIQMPTAFQVFAFVDSHVPSLRCPVVAELALVGLLPGVITLVHDHVAFVHRRVTAEAALVWLPAHVCPLVANQVALARSRVRTLSAPVRLLFSRVQRHVLH